MGPNPSIPSSKSTLGQGLSCTVCWRCLPYSIPPRASLSGYIPRELACLPHPTAPPKHRRTGQDPVPCPGRTRPTHPLPPGAGLPQLGRRRRTSPRHHPGTGFPQAGQDEERPPPHRPGQGNPCSGRIKPSPSAPRAGRAPLLPEPRGQELLPPLQDEPATAHTRLREAARCPGARAPLGMSPLRAGCGPGGGPCLTALLCREPRERSRSGIGIGTGAGTGAGAASAAATATRGTGHVTRRKRGDCAATPPHVTARSLARGRSGHALPSAGAGPGGATPAPALVAPPAPPGEPGPRSPPAPAGSSVGARGSHETAMHSALTRKGHPPARSVPAGSGVPAVSMQL